MVFHNMPQTVGVLDPLPRSQITKHSEEYPHTSRASVVQHSQALLLAGLVEGSTQILKFGPGVKTSTTAGN